MCSLTEGVSVLEYQQSYFILVIECTAVNKFAAGSPVSQMITVSTEQLVILETVFIFSIMRNFTVSLKRIPNTLEVTLIPVII